MTLLIELAVKSTIVAGVALVLLALLGRRSAAERSWIAHAALVVLAALPAAVLLLPRWRLLSPAESAPVLPVLPVPAASAPAIDPALWLQGFYAAGVALLLLATIVAILRLVALRRGAAVLVDPDWLRALARAKARMKVRAGAALLVSSAVTSPVSWGLIKPTIVVNEGLVASKDDAEAVIAHELAHVVRRDWAKLIGARVVTALFWFNPLVWALARQCHQLREEAADDAVLGAEVSSADYASLLVEAARHQGRGLAAHGVAPGKGSLHRRVTRVLDAAARRTPTPAAWAQAVALGAALFAGPLAAVTLEWEEAAPAATVTVTGIKVAAAEPGHATTDSEAAPTTVTIVGAPSGKTAPARAATATHGLTVVKAADPAVATTTGLARRKGKLTLAGASASPRLAIGKPGASRLTISGTASPLAPKVAIAAARPQTTTILAKPGKIVLADGLTMVRDDPLEPRTAVTVTGEASASSSSSHTVTVNGKTIRVETARDNDDRADRRADAADRVKDEADARRNAERARRQEAAAEERTARAEKRARAHEEADRARTAAAAERAAALERSKTAAP